MSSSTTILGPYDDLTTSDKIIVSGAIPFEVKNFLFEIFLPRRGATDKLITRCLYMLEAYLSEHPQLAEYEEHMREEIVNNLLNSFILHLQGLDPQELIPEPEADLPRSINPPSYVSEIL